MNRLTFSRALRLVALAIAAVIAADVSRAADDPWLQEVEAGYTRLDEKLHNFTVQARSFLATDLVGQPPGKKELKYTFELSRLGNSVKTKRTEASEEGEDIYVLGVNEDYFFAIGEGETGELRHLLDVGERVQFRLSHLKRRLAMAKLLGDVTGPLGNYCFPIESPIAVLKYNAPRLHAEEAALAGRKMLLLTGDFERFTDKADMTEQDVTNYSAPKSRIYLDPALDYRIVRWESEVTVGGVTNEVTDTYEYENSVDGYPVLSKFASRGGREAVGYETIEYEYSDWRLNENKPKEFRLTHYGLREPAYGAQPLLSGWMWLLLIGAALAGVGTWLYRRTAVQAAS